MSVIGGVESKAVQGGVMIAVAVTAGHFINDAYAAMLSPLGPALQSKYGVTIAAVTLLGSVFSFTSSVLQPVLGILGEKLGRRLSAAFGPTMTGLGLTLIGFVPWFGALVLLVAVAGLGSGFFHPAGSGYVARYSPADKRGLWASLFSAGGTAGMSLGPVFANVGLAHLHWFGLIGLVTGVITYLITPDDAQTGGRKQASAAEYLSIFKGPMVTLWAMAVLRSMASTGYNTMLPFILLQRGYSHAQAGKLVAITLGIYAVSAAVGGIVGGRLSDRVGRVPVLRSAILFTIPFFALLIYSDPKQWWFYPLTFLVGAAANASIPVGIVTAQEYAPKHTALASSIMMGFSWGVAGVLVVLVGQLADLTSPATAALCAILLLLPSVWLAYRLPEPQKAAFE